MSANEFDEVVREALGSLPPQLREVFDRQCVVVVEEWADEETLRSLGVEGREETPYGLYTGLPYGERGPTNAAASALPDVITIYRGPLLEDIEDRAELVEEIRVTVMHELGHALGFDEEDLEERGLG